MCPFAADEEEDVEVDAAVLRTRKTRQYRCKPGLFWTPTKPVCSYRLSDPAESTGGQRTAFPSAAGLPFLSGPFPRTNEPESRAGSLTLALRARPPEPIRQAPRPASHALLCWRTRRLRPAPYALGHQRFMLMAANDTSFSPRCCACEFPRQLATSRSRRAGLCFHCQLFSQFWTR